MSRRGSWVLGVGIAAVLLLAAGIWLWQSSSGPATAEDTATAYLRALESGDVKAVDSTGPGISEETGTAFAGAAEYITDGAVGDVDQQGDTAAVDVSFRLDREKRSATLTLTRQDGAWRIDSSGLGTLTAVPDRGAFVTVGDAVFAADDRITLLPARYPLSAAPDDLLDGTASAAVLPGESVETALAVELRDAATGAAQAALDEHLEACTAKGGEQPEGCGIRIPWGTEFREVADVRYRIDTLPSIALSGTGFTAGGGVLVATVTGTGHDGAERTTTYRTESWMVRGDVTFTETTIALTVW
ncbi:hypothetical protein SRABI76_00398 [Microbacterium oxydans]|uniref:hypothetical protein n=1 Tax=Microbacterium oxydans TaxID=82380 RepID=UPI001E010DCF|nr:hypothetical protein [Microbacterium oxydans]CAH0135093.1 hypothetical protein SRABI76_00398 [Microbacterium oxydans]